MAVQEFSKLYYRTANCLTSDIIADFTPVSRILGVDTSTGMGTVFTAMGTRFDLQYVARETFMATDSYEADTRSIDDTPVAEVMRYVRGEIISGGYVPDRYKDFVDTVLKGESVYGQYKEYHGGEEKGEILFLISPAAADVEKTADNFLSICRETGKSAYCTNRYKDCGYLLLQLNQTDIANQIFGHIIAETAQYDCIVTDDSYVLDALLIQFPELEEKIKFIDEFLADNQIQTGRNDRVVLHESGIIERLYPGRKADYKVLMPEAELILPKRSGYDVTDSGIAGGLGLAEAGNLPVIAGRRMIDLRETEHDVIVTPCAGEAAGLNCAEQEEVVTLLEYICR